MWMHYKKFAYNRFFATVKFVIYPQYKVIFMIKQFSLLTALALLVGCGSEKKELCATQESSVILVNVLDEKLFNDRHIAGSINVSLQDIAKAAERWDKKATVVIYCSNYMCTASGQAAKELMKLGFTDVRVYEGGTAEWHQLHKKDSTYALVGPGNEAYLNIVIEKPLVSAAEVKEISAQELKNLLKEAKILS